MRLNPLFVPCVGGMGFLREQPQGPDPCPGGAGAAAGSGWEPPVRFRDQEKRMRTNPVTLHPPLIL